MRGGGIVLGGQDEDVMPVGELAAEFERVDLGASRMPRHEVVNRVKHAQPLHRAGFIPAARFWLRSTHSPTPGVSGAIARASPHILAAAW